MPFKTSEQSFRSHQHLFRDRKLFCSAAPVDTRGPLALWCCNKDKVEIANSGLGSGVRQWR